MKPIVLHKIFIMLKDLKRNYSRKEKQAKNNGVILAYKKMFILEKNTFILPVPFIITSMNGNTKSY